MTQLLRETQKDGGHTNKLKQYKQKYKPRLNKTRSAQPGCMNWCTWKTKLPMYSLNARDHFNCSPLLFSWPAPQNRCGQMEGGARYAVFAHSPRNPTSHAIFTNTSCRIRPSVCLSVCLCVSEIIQQVRTMCIVQCNSGAFEDCLNCALQMFSLLLLLLLPPRHVA